jgi:hypothetical protein
MIRLGVALGANTSTFNGLSGLCFFACDNTKAKVLNPSTVVPTLFNACFAF